MAVTTISVPLKEGLGYYNEGTTVPANTNTDGTNVLETGITNGQIEIVLEAATDVYLTDDAIITFTVSSSSADDGTFSTIHSLAKTADITATGEISFEAGTIIDSFVIPTGSNTVVDEWTKVNVATDDALATGTYNAYIRRIVK